MKKIILTLITVIATTVSMSAMNLKEAFNALSNIPNVSVQTPDYNLPVNADIAQTGQIAGAYNLTQQQIEQTGNAAYVILNQIPFSYMVNGGNNGEVAAFVYATPNQEGSNDVLVVAMSGYKGSAVFIYGTLDNAAVQSLQSAPLNIQGNFLSLEATMPDGNDFNIILSKAR
ncbi:MAG: hypothetical protein K2H47_10455 [Muribaculaceae bacterium]|nr:hypothetical protein [Muribaculaceae bacterium]